MSIELQQKIVIELAEAISSDWDAIKADIEIGEIDGELVLSPDCYLILNDNSEQIRIDFDVKSLFEQLRNEMSEVESNSEPWSICYLEIKRSGEFTFNFSYDAPPRLTKLASF